jgi:hypothetical protein
MVKAMVKSSSSSASTIVHRKQTSESPANAILVEYLASLLDQLRDQRAFERIWKVPDAPSASTLIISHLTALDDPRLLRGLETATNNATTSSALHLACRIPVERLGLNVIKHILNKYPEQQHDKDANGKTPQEIVEFSSYLKFMK